MNIYKLRQKMINPYHKQMYYGWLICILNFKYIIGTLLQKNHPKEETFKHIWLKNLELVLVGAANLDGEDINLEKIIQITTKTQTMITTTTKTTKIMSFERDE